MKRDKCNCKGPALRSYAHQAHLRNDDLPMLPARAVKITSYEANILLAKKFRLWEEYSVYGYSGDRYTCSTLRVERDQYSTLPLERIGQIISEHERTVCTARKKRHIKFLAEVKLFAPDWRQKKYSGWKITEVTQGAVLSPEGFEQAVREVALITAAGTIRYLSIIRDDRGVFLRECSLQTLQSRLDAEVPTRARHDSYIRQGDIYFYPRQEKPTALEEQGEPCRERINNTRHVATGYRLQTVIDGRLRIYYAPGTRIAAPDHPALVLSRWAEVESAYRGD